METEKTRLSECLLAIVTCGALICGCSGDAVDDGSAEEGESVVESDWRAETESERSNSDSSGGEASRSNESIAVDEPASDPAGEDLVRPEDSEFVAHEWGTFTSVVDSNGTYLPGLHHEGVALPAFVHELGYAGVGTSEYIQGHPRVYLPEMATQKLETPVIYFYTDRPREVSVDVGFPEGYINKWYPDSVARTPKRPDQCPECTEMDLEEHGLDELADGRMRWDVSITHDDRASAMVEVPSDDIWAPSREVPDAAFVEHGGETDRFIFYRGVGRAEPPFTVEAESTPEGPVFTFTNGSDERIPNVYLMDIREEKGRISALSSLESGASKTFRPTSRALDKERFVERASEMVERGLIETGLTPDESEAMVETWSHSYFRATGYRVLYVLPRAWTDRMLPIEIKPEPDELVRTIVGRIEVMTPAVERETLSRIRRAHQNHRTLAGVFRGGRFEEAHFRRACQLAEEAELRSWCETELGRLASTVISEDGRSGY